MQASFLFVFLILILHRHESCLELSSRSHFLRIATWPARDCQTLVRSSRGKKKKEGNHHQRKEGFSGGTTGTTHTLPPERREKLGRPAYGVRSTTLPALSDRPCKPWICKGHIHSTCTTLHYTLVACSLFLIIFFWFLAFPIPS